VTELNFDVDDEIDSNAEALLSPLAQRSALAELFWQRRFCWLCEISGGELSPPVASWTQGIQFFGVGESDSVTTWTVDLSVEGLRAALAACGLAAKVPAFCPWEDRPFVNPVSPALGQAWRERLEALVVRMTGGIPRGSIHGSIELFVEERGARTDNARARRWGRSGGLISASVEGVNSARSLMTQQLDPHEVGLDQMAEDLIRDWTERPSERASLPARMPVVLAPVTSAGFLHEVVGHALEADHVLSGLSPFSELSFGDEVGSEQITVIDSPDAAHGCGWLDVDDQGATADEVVLVDRGCLAGLMHDRVSAAMAGVAHTGNGRRRDYRDSACPRMRNIVIAPGPHEPTSLMSGISDGLYIERLGAGQADLAADRFVFAVAAARRIRNGVPREAVGPLMVSGGITATLAEIEGVANDLVVSGEPHLCEKGSTVVTGLAGPTLRLGQLEVLG